MQSRVKSDDITHSYGLWHDDDLWTGYDAVPGPDFEPGPGSAARNTAAPGSASVNLFADDGSVGSELGVTATAPEKAIEPRPGSANPSSANVTTVSSPTEILFSATDGTHGYELWGTDGTAAGTAMIKDINPGSSDSLARYFTVLGTGKVVFEANDGTHGDELWVTDGTSAGTAMVKDTNPGTSTFVIHNLTALGNGTAIFADNDGTHGRELWVTDGTAAGTSLVKDINSGAGNSDPGYFSRVAVLGSGKAVFSANDGTHGYELWVTDGTAAGTALVDDINPGSVGSKPQQLTAIGNGKALFQADDGIHGGELWITDGTAAGTALVKDIKTVGFSNSYPSEFTVLGSGKVLFDANDGTHGNELWITDGTYAGTSLVKDINPGVSSSLPSADGNIVALGNGKALFTADDGTHGYELWVTDGTAGGTSLVKDIYPGVSSGIFFSPHLTSLGNGKALFAATDGTHGTELWISDGTAAGTSLVKDINPGLGSSLPRYFTVFGSGTVLFEADDGIHGGELWVTDGTAAGTVLQKDIFPGSGTANPNGFTITDITAPVEPQSMLPVAVGGTATISANFLTSSDPDNTAAQLTYTIDTPPAHGVLLLNGSVISTFTQDDINNNRVQYRENGDLAAKDAFAFTLSDPAGNRIGPETFQIAIVNTTLPVIETNTALLASPGVPVRVWTSSLCTVALRNNPDQIVYRLLAQPAHGGVFVGSAAATGFTQADIDNGYVGYVNDGDGATNDGFSFLVSDAAGDQTAPTSFAITIVPSSVACFCRGTRIMTNTGEVTVEDLVIGDRLVTLSGLTVPIKWIGRRGYDRRFVTRNRDMLPVCIAAGAIADGIPARDLWVSPEHALYLDGVLAAARLLVNGMTIVQAEQVDRLEYFHIELEWHDILIAHDLPTESYIECDNRGMFQNAAEFAALYPNERAQGKQFCAPRLVEGSAELIPIRAALRHRAEALGYGRLAHRVSAAV